jgi:GNAT superfamily N-acetyltransferase
MSGYRFCRSDDLGLLASAHDSCLAEPVEGEAPLAVADLKLLAREIDLWSSSCMLALAGDRPVGVLLAAKRERASLVYRIGVHPDHRRRGHGRHLLDSLGRKAAILGPPRLVAEVPDDRPGAQAFFEACGWRPGATYADFELGPLPDAEGPLEPAEPVTLDDVVGSGAWEPGAKRSWERELETLKRRAGRLEGLGVVSDRLEAWVLHRRARDGRREVVALGHAPGEQARVVLGILVRRLACGESAAVVVPRVSFEEIDPSLLESWGFRRTRGYRGYAIAATG